jgi:hypothetical protein
MFIRHAEKPDATAAGVTPAGTPDKEDLIVQGWQRAGALGRFFAPVDPATRVKGISQPGIIYAAMVNAKSSSLRPQHTVGPLAGLLNLTVDICYGEGDEPALAKAAIAAAQTMPVLIAWQHQDIPTIIKAINGHHLGPHKWPGDRFDLVWVLDGDGKGGWTFSQVPQLLLPGDSATLVPVGS